MESSFFRMQRIWVVLFLFGVLKLTACATIPSEAPELGDVSSCTIRGGGDIYDMNACNSLWEKMGFFN